MKQFISKTIGFMLALSIIFTGIPAMQVQAASKPVISSSQVNIKKNSCSVKKGKKVKLAAKYGKKDITKKATWKSSKKSVATISKTGVLTAKKAGTTYITVKYKGKTSSKLKVTVKVSAKPAPKPDDTPGNSFTITYNKNSKNKSDKLKGSSTQKVATASGEILKFSTTVTSASGKKFLGWYDAPTGGNRIYETYKPTGNMTLYAHYTDENAQNITFTLGCSYGNKSTGEKVSFMGDYQAPANRSYSYPALDGNKGPMSLNDASNMQWKHTYTVSDKKKITIDSLPEPSIPGYTFLGWYTTDQNVYSTQNNPELWEDGNAGVLVGNSTEVKAGQTIGTDITRLYARFSKKITVSFDDLHGGTYPDIVVDSYSTAKDCGYNIPMPEIPGVTVNGWAVNVNGYFTNINNNYVFGNLFFNAGRECHALKADGSVCCEVFRDDYSFGLHNQKVHNQLTGSDGDVEMYEETDHITLYLRTTPRQMYFGFDPKGGNFSKTNEANAGLTVYNQDEADFKKGLGYLHLTTDGYYGSVHKYIPGHNGDEKFVYYANNAKLPFVSKNNYIFDGWLLPDGTKLTDETWVTANTTLSAKWLPGTCYVMFDPTDGTLTQAEINRVGLDGAWRYEVTTESSVKGSGKQLPVPVSSEGRKFEGWFTKDGEQVTESTKITKDTYVEAHWGTKTDSKPKTQKPSKDKDTDSNSQNEIVQHVTDITVTEITDYGIEPVDRDNNQYTVEYGGKGNPTGLGFTATVLPTTLKDTARNVIWTSSNPNIIAVTTGKEVIYSPNWFDYFEFGTDVGDVVLTVTSEDNPSISFDIHVTVIKK